MVRNMLAVQEGSISFNRGVPGSSGVKNPHAVQKMQETRVGFLGREDLLEWEMAAHFNILAGKSPTEEPGRLLSMGWQRVEHL